MENNPESAGRGLRAGVISISLGLCLLLFWGIKGAFNNNSASDSESNPDRKTSFTPIKKDHVIQRSDRIPSDTNAPVALENTGSVPTPRITPPAKSIPDVVTNPAPIPPNTAGSAEVVRIESNGAATAFGSLSGKIILQGTPEPEKPLPLDPACGKLHAGAKSTTQFYVVAADGGLADVFVHVTKGLENRNFLPPEKPVVLDQVNCVYTPYVVGAQTGQMIEVRNSDPLMHNVHPTPAVKGNPEHNRVQLAKAQPLLFRWDQSEVFLRFKCDVHPWMFSYVGLVDHPYFAVTDRNGEFTIPNLPPGNYTIEFYHRRSGKVTHEVSIEAHSNRILNGRFEIPK